MDGILHVVAHDLKAPLNQTSGLVNLLLEGEQLTQSQASYLNMILKVNGNADRLVRDLVEISKLESEKDTMQLESLDLVQLTKETVSFLEIEARRKSIALELSLPDQPLVIASERSFISRILENLVTNAVKFSPTNKRVFISLSAAKDGVMIEIADEGPGISEDDQRKLFKKFQRLSARPTAGENSTGLGLAIVQALVIRLGGTIGVESKLGAGTRFKVWIPK
jgi:two-component system, sensor histidine kinase and response regulator